ncbi:hypothetical protein [Corynebacterium sp. MNWGS58]|uniref:hypothetical protein n=1 Tax=Corynebacterium sp. 102791.4 TaxID=3104612 RepID=UPI003514B7AC
MGVVVEDAVVAILCGATGWVCTVVSRWARWSSRKLLFSLNSWLRCLLHGPG